MNLKTYKDFIIESKEDLWTYDGYFKVDRSMVMNGKFIKDEIPDVVEGYFDCSELELTSLEYSPRKVEGDFYCNNNNLCSLGLIPREIKGSFDCTSNVLTSLEGAPKEIKGYFDCSYNKLTSLEGGPKKIEDSLCCDNNLLISLYGHPKEIGGSLLSDLIIESNFINSGSYIDNYWMDLLKYMIKEKIDLSEVKGWPEGFITDETIKSVKGISKFNL